MDQNRQQRTMVPVLLLAVLVVFCAQQVLLPVFAPLGREVGLSDIAIGAVITIGAAVFAASSPVWGRGVDRLGHRRVLLLGLTLAVVGLLGFAVVGQVAIAGDIQPAPTFVAMLLTRSVLFGAGVGAVAVASNALVASTTSQADRTRGIGQLQAAQGLSLVLGPAAGAALAFAGLAGPLWAAPAFALLALVVVALLLPAGSGEPDTSDEVTSAEGAPRRLRPWDPRLWPVLLAGFGAYLTLGMLLVVLGFLVQDRLGLDADATARTTGLVLVITGVVLILTQGVLVPRLRWPPGRLLRTGLPVAVIAVLVLVPAQQTWSIATGVALLALGLGVALPGYVAAPTLLVGPGEQGSVAGLVQTTTGATFVVAPLLGAGLYEVSPATPLIVGSVVCGLATAFVWLHPAFRASAAPPRPVGTEIP